MNLSQFASAALRIATGTRRKKKKNSQNSGKKQAPTDNYDTTELIILSNNIQHPISNMKLAILASILGSAAAFAPAQTGRATTAVSESKADLEALAKKLNPVLGFYDPLNLAEAEFWGQSNEATIGFLRHSEIKHGRIAVRLSPFVTLFLNCEK